MLDALYVPPSTRTAPSEYVYYTENLDVLYAQYFNVTSKYLDIKSFDTKISLSTQISMEISKLNYNIVDIKKSEFKDAGKSFKVYTVELEENIEDYSVLLQEEKKIRRDLGLYDKNIILEIV
ncbi:MAG: hypothetical protein M0Q24_10210 [Sulfurimonas sp.]|uniref:hypothetical protein n=1 Tax=Sulfurimonas sp. TaxID=2022749 RepID=UPI0025E3F346|nr:hypothetical protein [Sulfurimonas sp.]MCK9492456.1 hypothetical protein [Sulfurimonas sp.]